MITLVAIRSKHSVSTYCVPVVTELSALLRHQRTPSQSEENGAATLERRKSRAEPAIDSSALEGKEISAYLFHLLKT